jgi:hypothetical protein
MKPLDHSPTCEATLKIVQMFKQNPSFYATWWLYRVFTVDIHRAVFWARLIKSSFLYLLFLLHYPSIQAEVWAVASPFKKFSCNSLWISYTFRACYLSSQPHKPLFDYVLSLCLISNRFTPDRRAPCLFGRKLYFFISTLYFLLSPSSSLISVPKIQEAVCQLWIPVRNNMFPTSKVFYFQPPGLAVSCFVYLRRFSTRLEWPVTPGRNASNFISALHIHGTIKYLLWFHLLSYTLVVLGLVIRNSSPNRHHIRLNWLRLN